MNKITLPCDYNIYKEIVEYFHHGVMVIDNDLNFVDVNKEGCNILGYSKEELLNMKIENIIARSNFIDRNELWQELMNKGGHERNIEILRKDGKKIVILYIAINNITPGFHLFIFRDITKIKQNQKELRFIENRYKAIVQDDDGFICRFTPDGTITFVNDALCKYLSEDFEDLIGSKFTKYISENIMKDIEHELKHFSKDSQVRSYENFIKLPSGEKKWQHWILRALFDESDNIIEFQAVGRDCTKQKQLQEKLCEAMAIINKSHSVAFTWKNVKGWPVEFVSENVERLFGYTAEDFISGKIFYESCIHPDDLKRVAQEVENYSNEKDRIEFEHEPYRIITKDGEIKYIRDWSHIVRDSEGNITHYKGIVEDITERKIAENRLKYTNKQLMDIIDFLPDATVVVNSEKKIISWNRSMEKMTGVLKEEIIGKDHSYAAIPFYGEQRSFLIDLIFNPDSDIALKYDFVKRKGNILYVEVFTPALYGGKGAYVWATASPLLDSEGNIIGAIESIRDITEVKMMEKALRESEEKYRTLFEDSKNPIWTTNREGIIIDANQSAAELLGFEKNELIGLNVNSLYIDSSNRKIFQQEIETKGFVKNFHSQWKTKDGRQLDLLFDFNLWKDSKGEIIGYRGIAQDITLLKRSQKQLEENLEYFAHLVDHIRNPLAIICGFTQLEIENEHTKKRFLRQIRRIEDIIKQLDQGWMDTEDTRKFLMRYM